MISDWRRQLDRHCAAWGLPQDGQWDFLINNNYHAHHSGLIIFWFHRRERDPLIVTKVFLEPTLPQEEFRNLHDAHSFAPESVPRPLGLYQEGEYWALWMSAAAGCRLTLKDVSELGIDRLCDTLASIHLGVAAKRPRARRQHDSVVRDPFATVSQLCPSLSDACERTSSRYTQRWLDALPSLPQHGDLFCDNILVQNKEPWRVVDWEYLGQTDLPYYDLMTFLLSIAGHAPPNQWSVRFQQYACRCLNRYPTALGLNMPHFSFMLPLLLANWAHLQRPSPRRNSTIAILGDVLSNPQNWEKDRSA